jgi:putative transposase
MEIVNPTKKYHTSHNWVYNCQYHVVWCPKYRRKVLVPPIDARLKELFLEKQAEYGYQVIDMEVMPDHVHLLLDVNPQVGIKSVVSQIKGYTSATSGHELFGRYFPLRQYGRQQGPDGVEGQA